MICIDKLTKIEFSDCFIGNGTELIALVHIIQVTLKYIKEICQGSAQTNEAI